MSQQVADTPIEARAFNIGMHFVQQAMLARLGGNEKKANYFLDEFLNLCQGIMKDINQAVKLPEDQTMNDYYRVNFGRMSLKKELNTAILNRDKNAKQKISEAYQNTLNTCQVFNLCLKNHIASPPIEKNIINYRMAVIDHSIEKGSLRIEFKELNTLRNDKKTLFTLRVYIPFSDPFATGMFNQGNLHLEYTLKVLRKDTPQYIERFCKKQITIELVEMEKKTFSKLYNEKVVASLKVPLSLFAAKNSFQKTYLLENQPDAPKNEQYTLTVKFSMSSSLLEYEYEDRSTEFYSIKPGSKLEFPWSQKLRQFSSLSKQEFLALHLTTLPKIPDPSFLCQSYLVYILKILQGNIKILKDNKIEIPPGLESKELNYREQLKKLVADRKGPLTPEVYKSKFFSMMKEQIDLFKSLQGKPDYAEMQQRMDALKDEYNLLKTPKQ